MDDSVGSGHIRSGQLRSVAFPFYQRLLSILQLFYAQFTMHRRDELAVPKILKVHSSVSNCVPFEDLHAAGQLDDLDDRPNSIL